MRPGRELDCEIAQRVFGYPVFAKKKVLYETTEDGIRPVREYSKEMEWAWKVAEKMHMSLIPVENNGWFVLAGSEKGWKSPADFMQYLQEGNFVQSGAAVGENAPLMICVAALKALESRQQASLHINDDDLNDDQSAPMMQMTH